MLEAVNAEDWSPEAAPVREAMIEKLHRSMIYVGLFGAIYSEATELEYRAALANPYRERMIYIRNMPEEQRAPQLCKLISELQNSNVTAKFNDVLDLLPRFIDHLRDALVRIALKLRMLGEPVPVAKSRGGASGLERRWEAERRHLLAFGFSPSTPEAIADLVTRIQFETSRTADGPPSR